MPTNLPWIVWQDGSGPWLTLIPKSPGLYEFSPTGSRYGVATVDASGTFSQGRLYYRTTATTTIEISTGAAPSDNFTFGGQMTNVPPEGVSYRFGRDGWAGYSGLAVTAGSANYTLYGFAGVAPYDFAIALSNSNNGSTCTTSSPFVNSNS